MSNTLRIRTLLDRFFDGETSLAEEQELYDYFHKDLAALPEDLAPLREMFLDLAAVPYEGVVATQSQQTVNRRWYHWAAAVALPLVVGASVLFIHSPQTDDECVAIVYGERTTDRTVVLTEMQKTMAAVSVDGSDVVESQLKSMFSN
ncbi:MAG: hypothetical protein J6W19_01485 [Prevotella sp.]|nr:hypothetical protein [Prevotella sp.]